MIGYAIAALKKESKIIGLRVLLLDIYEYKDLDMKSVLYLKAKSSDMIYNLSSFTTKELQKLPVLDIVKNILNKDIYTVLMGQNKQYLISNAFGTVFTIDEVEAKKLSFSNADEDMSGYFVEVDYGKDAYERSLAFESSNLKIVNGELEVVSEISGDLIVPSIVEHIADDCWLRAGKINTLILSPNMKEIVQGDMDGLEADVVILPVGISKIKAFGCSGCHINKLVIQGNTLVTKGAFNNSNIKEIYVNNALINKYRSVITGRIAVKDVSLLA